MNNVGHNPKTVIVFFLSEGLQFAIPPTEIEFLDFMLPFELLYRDIKSKEVSNEI